MLRCSLTRQNFDSEFRVQKMRIRTNSLTLNQSRRCSCIDKFIYSVIVKMHMFAFLIC